MAVILSGTTNDITIGGVSVATDTEVSSAITAAVNTAGIALKTIASGTATFTATTNNINLAGIGIGVEIGDVIQISGADDAKNNSEFTIEVITDNDNIIVNQAHANKGTSKNVANRVSDTGVTVKLLAKWYNAGSGLGQGWVNVTSSRVVNTAYTNNTKRVIKASLYLARTASSAGLSFLVGTENIGGIIVANIGVGVTTGSTSVFDIPVAQTYTCQTTLPNTWYELR